MIKTNDLAIGEVARRTGLRPSAVRYYETMGLVAPNGRSGGRRIYGEEAVERLALISLAKEAGFSLEEIRRLLAGFREEIPASARWTELATSKLSDLDAMSQRIDAMRELLKGLLHCRCVSLDQCARGIARKRCR
jgi:MerR family transcriptional regulator, redox-sensitive transcriptional activator SoxR